MSMPSADQSWLSPPVDLTLAGRELHVWRIRLEGSAAARPQLAHTLSADEHRRAARFYFEKDRRHFIASRGALRCLLSRYLHIPPERLQFRYGAHGKPALAPERGGDALHFNVSHSHGLALCAFAYAQDIGVDLEYVHPLDDLEPIAQRFFSAYESSRLLALLPAQRLEAFYNCWTRKEAYIKACGAGLAYALNRFDVSLAPGEPAQILSIDGSASKAARWFLQALTPAPDYAAAVAVEGQGWHIQCWQWPGD
ncbi:MAG TPA: 4'-phosphopantetheinyl transferase superfamily protein [Anaerolineae bacterium]|nr:4'-phosphopantetheinyl transferase superfamily protein [Anaerolineae bacterium]